MTPDQLGAPARYTGWRRGQDRAWEKLQHTTKRFPVLKLPTGIGKSLVYVVDAIFNQHRMVALTSTRGLEDQLERDYSEAGLVDIRGMANYPCLELGGRHHCGEGPCLDGFKCDLKAGGCLYFDAERVAQQAQLVSTNYAYWLTQASRGSGLGERDMLVLDEAHEAAEEIGRHMRIEIGRGEVALPDSTGMMDIEGWRRWATRASWAVGKEAKQSSGAEGRRLWKLSRKLEALAETQGEWVPAFEGGLWTFEPLWPARYAEELLFRGIQRIVLSSATIVPKALDYLGIDRTLAQFIEAPNPIPAGRRPIIWVPTVGVKESNTPNETSQWLDAMDQAIDRRLDRKGIIHAVSYARARLIMDSSRYSGLMITHGSEGAKQAVAEFLAAESPAILLSPSVATGYDFPYEAAEYQLVPKVPFPGRTSPMVVARERADADYPKYVALTKFEQMVGRVSRAPDDLGETLVFDNNINWLLWGYKEYTSQWLRDAYRKEVTIPGPPAKLS